MSDSLQQKWKSVVRPSAQLVEDIATRRSKDYKFTATYLRLEAYGPEGIRRLSATAVRTTAVELTNKLSMNVRTASSYTRRHFEGRTSWPRKTGDLRARS